MRNLRLAVPLSFISMLFFPSATWMFFYLQHLSFQQIATIMGIGAISSMILEVPTGVFADVVGRKWAVALSYLLFTVAMVGVAYSTTYWAFLGWTLVNTAVNALYSGSMEALVYDTLKENNREAEYDHWVSRMEAVTWVGLFVSAVVGGYMYVLSPRLPFFAQAGITTVAAIFSLFLIEPRLDSVRYRLGDMLVKNVAGIKELLSNTKMRYYTLIFVVIGLGYYVAADILGISQAREYGLDTRMVGWVFGTGYIISAIAAHFYPQMRKGLGEMRLVWVSAGALLTSFLLAKFVGVWAGVALIILRIASSTTFRNSRSVIINREIGSRDRATTLSTLTLLTELPYALGATLIGAYIDRTSPNQFAWVLGVGIISLLILTQILIWRGGSSKILAHDN